MQYEWSSVCVLLVILLLLKWSPYPLTHDGSLNQCTDAALWPVGRLQKGRASLLSICINVQYTTKGTGWLFPKVQIPKLNICHLSEHHFIWSIGFQMGIQCLFFCTDNRCTLKQRATNIWLCWACAPWRQNPLQRPRGSNPTCGPLNACHPTFSLRPFHARLCALSEKCPPKNTLNKEHIWLFDSQCYKLMYTQRLLRVVVSSVRHMPQSFLTFAIDYHKNELKKNN